MSSVVRWLSLIVSDQCFFERATAAAEAATTRAIAETAMPMSPVAALLAL